MPDRQRYLVILPIKILKIRRSISETVIYKRVPLVIRFPFSSFFRYLCYLVNVRFHMKLDEKFIGAHFDSLPRNSLMVIPGLLRRFVLTDGQDIPLNRVNID